jgi:hypothetical protein
MGVSDFCLKFPTQHAFLLKIQPFHAASKQFKKTGLDNRERGD